MRELTAAELTYLFGDEWRDSGYISETVLAYNEKGKEHPLNPIWDNLRGRWVFYRESLPGHFQDELDQHELTLDAPYVEAGNVLSLADFRRRKLNQE